MIPGLELGPDGGDHVFKETSSLKGDDHSKPMKLQQWL